MFLKSDVNRVLLVSLFFLLFLLALSNSFPLHSGTNKLFGLQFERSRPYLSLIRPCPGEYFEAGKLSPLMPDTVVISTGEWAPWIGEDMEGYGFVGRLIKKAFAREGYDVKFQFYPWERAFRKLMQGEVHASAYWFESEEREKYAYYSKPLTVEQTVFWYRRDNPLNDWEELRDLQNYRIGASRGITYTEEFWQLAREGVLDIDLANDDLSNFRKLLHGRVDLFPSSKINAREMLERNLEEAQIKQLDYHERSLRGQTGHLLFPRGYSTSRALLEIFNRELEELKDESVYEELYQELIEPYE